MKGEFERLCLIPLGILALCEEKVKSVASELSEKGKVKEKELKDKLNELKKRSVFATVEKKSNIFITRLLDKLDVPRRSEISQIKREIEELKEMIREKL